MQRFFLFLNLLLLLTPGGAFAGRAVVLSQAATGPIDGNVLSTTVTIANTSGGNCSGQLVLTEGNGVPPDTTTIINSQQVGQVDFNLGPFERRIFQITNLGGVLDVFAAQVNTALGCEDFINAYAILTTRSEEGELIDFFSYNAGPVLVPDTCVNAAVINQAGYALVNSSDDLPPPGTEICLNRLMGGVAVDSFCFPFDGRHRAQTVAEVFEPAIFDTFQICLNSESPELMISPLILQFQAEGENVQLQLAPHYLVGQTCFNDGDTLCLLNERFSVSVQWDDGGTSKVASVLGERSDLGSFKVGTDGATVNVGMIDSCEENGHFWFFYGDTFDSAYTVTVKDTKTDQTRVFGSDQAPSIVVEAFATCP